MTAQDFYHTSPSTHRTPARRTQTDPSAIVALGIGALVAAGLIWLAQGTVQATDMPDWHGNVAASETARITAR